MAIEINEVFSLKMCWLQRRGEEKMDVKVLITTVEFNNDIISLVWKF